MRGVRTLVWKEMRNAPYKIILNIVLNNYIAIALNTVLMNVVIKSLVKTVASK